MYLYIFILFCIHHRTGAFYLPRWYLSLSIVVIRIVLLSLVVWVFLLEFIIYRFDGNSITSNSIDSIYSRSKNFNFKRYSYSYWAIQNFMTLKGYSFHLWIYWNYFILGLHKSQPWNFSISFPVEAEVFSLT